MLKIPPWFSFSRVKWSFGFLTCKNVSAPLISAVSQKLGISLNIIFADITIVQDAPIGGTVTIIHGARKQITEAMEYLIEKNVGVEVIRDARISE